MSISFAARWLKAPPALALLALLATGCKKDDSGGSSPTPPPPVTPTTGASQMAVWLTTPDKSALFYRQKVNLQFGANTNSNPTIVVDTTQTYQTMDGFGYALTGGSAQVMSRMSAPARAALIKELFATDSTSLGVSYLRISIGASDLDASVFSYDDGPADPTLANFSLAPDQAALIPVLKEILAVNPAIKILGSPWSAPLWMKSNNNSVGGSLLPQYYDAYARYFVKYIQGMQAQGIPIDAVTLQNEPLYGGNNPSMMMQGSEQAAFIKNNVGPAFRAAGLSTKIIIYDHNPDSNGLQFVSTVLGDAGASPFVDGSAFHLYGGNIDALTGVHNAFPSKNVYFTELWTQAPGTSSFSGDLAFHVQNLEIGAPRNWSRNVLEWNLASDQNFNPHTPGGCDQCLGAVTINGDAVTRNVAYYSVAHASKFVRPGSVRVATNVPGNLQNVAYKTPNGKRCLVVLNTSTTLQNFNIQYKGKVVSTSLYGGAVATYIW
ncbi:glucosylceramidase [Hymenobacter ginsengisoli]|uniref:Glucosylceramidase n=1 Tax=Hymenobacter ginsengisoli TaxID=1051626 RepID=A0ABP8Q033_9BACT|nr:MULTISPECIES: glycoside hydrolase family 30 beta sandwich domain-containing protein [unclassified Hymenobacter]MBO2030453.1 glucosylceramidase [Hymenobacter sp. BT559]